MTNIYTKFYLNTLVYSNVIYLFVVYLTTLSVAQLGLDHTVLSGRMSSE
jgi:hypothetical protein